MSKIVALLFCALPLWAQTEPVPHHFLNPSGWLTPPSSRPARDIASDYLREITPRFNLTPDDLLHLEVVKEYRTVHNGVTHLVFQPRYQELDVYNAEWTVNIRPDGSIINAGGTLAPAPAAGTEAPNARSVLRSVRTAANVVNPRIGGRFAPFQTAGPGGHPRPGGHPARRRTLVFAADGFGRDIEAVPVWYATSGGTAPAWVFYILDDDGVSNYEVVVDDRTQAILAKHNLTWFDGPKAMVFDHSSPQPNPNPGVLLTSAPPIVNRTMQPLTGDPASSSSGWVAGTETAGNNVIVGTNRLGALFVPPQTSSAANGDFTFPLQLGPGAPNPTNFADAANANLFYWINRAHDQYYGLGFDEPAGNYQQDNFGRGGVDGDAMLVYSQFAAAAPVSAALNNSFYTSQRSGEDGALSMLAIYLDINRSTGTFVDTAYDPEVVVHEYTHGVSTRLIRQFFSGYPQAGAMGEAFSDFFGLELTLPDNVPVDGSYTQGSYFAQNFTAGSRTYPYSTDLKVNPLTFDRFGLVRGYPEVHSDGEIWVEALWEVRAAYIRQFGDQEGRRRVRLAVVDGMKLAPPAPSMLDMRDAILLADRVDFNGESQTQLWQAFARRGFGVLALAASSSAVHITPSAATPGDTPAIRVYDDAITIGEPLRLMVYLPDHTQPNVKVRVTTTYGDAEDVYLDRRGFTYTGSISTTEFFSTIFKGDSLLQLVPGDTITATYSQDPPAIAVASARQKYSMVLSDASFGFQNEKALGLRGSGIIQAVTLPFAFPFYDSSYTIAQLHTNGFLAFTGPLSTSCADSFTLQQHAAVSPLWLNSTVTSGTAQSGEDVYQSSTSDSVTYRFASQVSSSGGTTEPLNFATSLFQDGHIEFHYGTGNHNLVTNSCGTLPLIGVANGHETYYQVASLSGRTDLSNASTVVIYPNFGATSAPKGTLENPAAGAHVPSRFTVTGFRYDDTLPVTRVDLLIDGVSVSHGSLNARRDDICSAQNVNGCPFIGFNFSVNAATLGLAAGDHTVQVHVTNARSGSANIPETPVTFTIDTVPQTPPSGKIEAPADGASITGTATVSGYIFSPDLRVLAVDVLIDGVTYGPATYGVARTAICASGEGPNCPNVGFTFTLNTKSTALPVSVGQHSLAVRARDELGKYTLIPSNPITITVK